MDNKISKNIIKNRHRNIIWFNSPFCKLSNIIIGRYFLDLISKHFKDDNLSRKITNKNTVIMSYSCTNSMSKMIGTHSNKLITKLD